MPGSVHVPEFNTCVGHAGLCIRMVIMIVVLIVRCKQPNSLVVCFKLLKL